MRDAREILFSDRLQRLEHWRAAAERLADLDALASREAWRSLEHYAGVALRQTLAGSVGRLRAAIDALVLRVLVARAEPRAVPQSAFTEVRRAYLRTEATLDFFADALATRAHPETAALLRACDHIATRSMAEALAPLGREAPATLTYLDKGLGASILKAGLRLYDPRSENPVAAIKVVRHNLVRPTSLLHEAGHHVFHMLGWVAPLAEAMRAAVEPVSRDAGELWASWASEVAADAFAFVHSGFAQLLPMRDVVDGSDEDVFRVLPGDPHPPPWLRVLLGVEMCRRAFGRGPWDAVEIAWLTEHPLERAPEGTRLLYEGSRGALPALVEVILYRGYPAFAGRPLAGLLDPQRVSPGALAELEAVLGRRAMKPYVAWNEAIRILALTGYRAGVDPSRARQAAAQQEQFMYALGGLRSAA
jgi:hypothetical protein